MSNLRKKITRADFDYDSQAGIESADEVRTKLFNAYDAIVEAHDALDQNGEMFLNDSGEISAYYLKNKLTEMQMLISDLNEKIGNTLE